jgi:hypothetical protein
MSAELQAQYPLAFIGCNSNITSAADCTKETCCLAQGASFLYLPAFGPNLFFTIFFGVFIIPQIFLGVKYKTWGYMIGMVLGLLVEVIGYIGRVLLNDNPFSNDAFLM